MGYYVIKCEECNETIDIYLRLPMEELSNFIDKHSTHNFKDTHIEKGKFTSYWYQ